MRNGEASGVREPLLIQDLYAGYDGDVLHGISLEVNEGSSCASSARIPPARRLRTICLVPRAWSDEIFDGTDLMKLEPHEVPAGIAHVPQSTFFPEMTVEENP